MPFWTIVVTIFVTFNATGNIPVFIGMLRKFDHRRQQKIILREMLFALGIMLLFSYVGNEVLQGLNITIAVVRVAGGVILFLIALGMIFPKERGEEEAMQQEPFLVPLAIPIMAGSATISTVMIFAEQVQNQWLMTGCILVVWVPSLIILLLASFLKRVLGEQVLLAFERLSGMTLTFISVQMIAVGLTQYLSPPAA